MPLSSSSCKAGAHFSELLREAIEDAQITSERIEVRVAPDLGTIFVDARLIEQALVSILGNAERFTPAGKRIFAGVAQQDGEVIFTISDQGPGLSAEDEAKIFEKFYRGASNRTGGLGLGLSIAQRLIEAHGGSITARNRTEGGAQFTIRLPAGTPMQLPAEAVG